MPYLALLALTAGEITETAEKPIFWLNDSVMFYLIQYLAF